MVEYGGSNEQAAIVQAAGDATSAQKKLRFLLADFKVSQDGFELVFIHGEVRRSVLSSKPSPGRKFLCARDEQGHKLIGHFFLDDHATGRRAALARGTEMRRPQSRFHGQPSRSASASTCHDRIFSPPISHWHFFILRAPVLAQIRAADFIRSCEGNSMNIRMLHNLVAHIFAGSQHQI